MTMMKMKKNVLWLLLTVLAVAGFTSCGSDGDGSVVIPPSNPPKFESVSGKYEISDNTSPYESVELGASGDYVVTKRGYTYSQAPAKAKGMLSLECEASLTRAATDGGVIYGTYTQIDGNTFNLEGFGVIELITNGGGTVTGISITPNGGSEMTFSASKAQEMGSDELTEALCRTWKVIGGVEKGYDHYDGEYEYPFDANDPGALKEIMFTKSGTFLNLYNDNTIEALFWKWEDQGKMLLRGSWDNIWYNDDDGNFTIQFSAGNRLTIREYYVDNESGEWYDNTIELEEKNPASADDDEVVIPTGESPLEKVFTGNLTWVTAMSNPMSSISSISISTPASPPQSQTCATPRREKMARQAMSMIYGWTRLVSPRTSSPRTTRKTAPQYRLTSSLPAVMTAMGIWST